MTVKGDDEFLCPDDFDDMEVADDEFEDLLYGWMKKHENVDQDILLPIILYHAVTLNLYANGKKELWDCVRRIVKLSNFK